METLGITTEQIKTTLARGAEQPWTPKRVAAIKKGFQRLVRSRLLDLHCPDAETRMRHKLARWRFDGVPRIQAERAVRHLSALQPLVPPRVVAAVFSTIWNRWTTARRFQKRSSPENRCVLGCGGNAEDSLEHYGRCQVLLNFARRNLNLRFDTGDTLPYWMLVTADERINDSSPDVQVRIAVLVYAAYRTTNTARAAQRARISPLINAKSDCEGTFADFSDSDSGSSSDPDDIRAPATTNSFPNQATSQEAREMLAQFVYEGVKGHTLATRAIDRCWQSAARGNPRPRLR